MMPELLARVLQPHPPAFALLCRPESAGPGSVEVLVGATSNPMTIADLPLKPTPLDGAAPAHGLLALIPYRQGAERGLDCYDDGTPLVAITVTDRAVLPVEAVATGIPDIPIRLAGGHFDIGDEAYAEVVRRIVTEEIGSGKGANFVIKRSFVGTIDEYRIGHALALFRRLLLRESGAYWTFLVHTGTRTLVGASPERHVTMRAGTAVMNPISGTYRYPEAGPDLQGLLTFLADGKETDELCMVLDEELKMMARVCEGGGRVAGPSLREMAQLAHTEYRITGRCTGDPRTVLRETLFAPAVTGSPLESACRVIRQYETVGRGYYSGVLALITRGATGEHEMDSSILIRTADITESGRLAIGVGATLVRHSDPDAEVAETRAKAAALLDALNEDPEPVTTRHEIARPAFTGNRSGWDPALSYRASGTRQASADGGSTAEQEIDPGDRLNGAARRPCGLGGPAGRLAHRPEVRTALIDRNTGLADFWLTGPADNTVAALAGRRALIVDAEDSFTAMLEIQLRSLGLRTTVRRYDQPLPFEVFDLTVMGPGPGDPRSVDDPKINRLRADIGMLVGRRIPLLAVCLSHQLLSAHLGLPVVARGAPSQGARRDIGFFGTTRRVGFYNTFTAHSDVTEFSAAGIGRVEICRDAATREVHALRGPSFGSLQFHAESVLTEDGPSILAGMLTAVLAGRNRPSIARDPHPLATKGHP